MAGGYISRSARWPQTTVLVRRGTTRTVKLVAAALGDCAMHCHMTHHATDQLGHDLPLTLGNHGQRIDRHLQSVAPDPLLNGRVLSL
jgi:hypothetical protein